jgi:hypothetical protein
MSMAGVIVSQLVRTVVVAQEGAVLTVAQEGTAEPLPAP